MIIFGVFHKLIAMIRKFAFISFITALLIQTTFAREGLWIPALLKKYNIEEMQRMGFRLKAEDVYDVNHASMKDAVVIFGGGCTGELISGEGLLITNHHCGYGQIQNHSSIEHDYLTDGFWAKNRNEELACPGLTVSFLEYMEDVTEKVLAGTDTLTNQAAKSEMIAENSRIIEGLARQNGKLRAQVRPFFYGNQYFLQVYKVYTDVRLVGAPPSAIGKFGGDTDNWVWPRHTGDFSLFRIYANKQNEPAPYASDNVPFKPKKFFTISLKGVRPGDFTMVFGYPGRTTRYLTSEAVELIMNQRDPDRIAIRDIKLDVLNHFMEASPAVRIQYASKNASISNAWKKWQGEIMGLKKNNAITAKKQFEAEFESWAKSNNLWENRYNRIFSQSAEIHAHYAPYIKASDYYTEIVTNGIEIFTLASHINGYLKSTEKRKDFPEDVQNGILRLVSGFFNEYYQPLDEQLFTRLLPLLSENAGDDFLPEYYKKLVQNNTPDKLLEKVYRRSILSDSSKLKQLLKQKDVRKLEKLKKDPVILLYSQLRDYYDNLIQPEVRKMETATEEFMKLYMEGIMRMNEGKPLYPDANSTLRVSYGRVEGYQPRDGVSYLHYSTLDGVIEKDSPDIYDYDVPDKLKELHRLKDYGRYGYEGKMPVCFVASNHTSGGNSGSPVVNGDGQLIGVNFDRDWEGTMSDILYDPAICRNIVLDIRYPLFIIDKYAGAGYLLDEMDIKE
jgi:hypothetical protein